MLTEMRTWWSATLTSKASGVRSTVKEAFLSARGRNSRFVFTYSSPAACVSADRQSVPPLSYTIVTSVGKCLSLHL